MWTLWIGGRKRILFLQKYVCGPVPERDGTSLFHVCVQGVSISLTVCCGTTGQPLTAPLWTSQQQQQQQPQQWALLNVCSLIVLICQYWSELRKASSTQASASLLENLIWDFSGSPSLWLVLSLSLALYPALSGSLSLPLSLSLLTHTHTHTHTIVRF